MLQFCKSVEHLRGKLGKFLYWLNNVLEVYFNWLKLLFRQCWRPSNLLRKAFS